MKQIPFEIIQGMIQCFGRSFHYKDTVQSFFLKSGVPQSMATRNRELAKFIWARKLLTDLEQTEEGILIIKRILTNLCNLKNLPDKDVPDRNAGLDALRELKTQALTHNLIAKKQKESVATRKHIAEEKKLLLNNRAKRLENIYSKFKDGMVTENRQKAGYSLEDILKDLFAHFEIDYKKPYKLSTQQIDGHFKFESFDYLVEAKWKKDYSNESEIAAFKNKVESKLESTRGLFVSISGFRDEVIEQFNGRGANLIFMNGEDLVYILEGRIHLRDALTHKIDKAAQTGKVFSRLSDL
jgi:hypothetical protein